MHELIDRELDHGSTFPVKIEFGTTVPVEIFLTKAVLGFRGWWRFLIHFRIAPSFPYLFQEKAGLFWRYNFEYKEKILGLSHAE